MPDVYSNLNHEYGWIQAPGLVRRRAKFRAPRESLKTNQEISELRYDLWRLQNDSERIETEFIERSDALIDGGVVDNLSGYWTEDATPTLEQITLPGVKELQYRVESLRNRITKA